MAVLGGSTNKEPNPIANDRRDLASSHILPNTSIKIHLRFAATLHLIACSSIFSSRNDAWLAFAAPPGAIKNSMFYSTMTRPSSSMAWLPSNIPQFLHRVKMMPSIVSMSTLRRYEGDHNLPFYNCSIDKSFSSSMTASSHGELYNNEPLLFPRLEGIEMLILFTNISISE